MRAAHEPTDFGSAIFWTNPTQRNGTPTAALCRSREFGSEFSGRDALTRSVHFSALESCNARRQHRARHARRLRWRDRRGRRLVDGRRERERERHLGGKCVRRSAADVPGQGLQLRARRHLPTVGAESREVWRVALHYSARELRDVRRARLQRELLRGRSCVWHGSGLREPGRERTAPMRQSVCRTLIVQFRQHTVVGALKAAPPSPSPAVHATVGGVTVYEKLPTDVPPVWWQEFAVALCGVPPHEVLLP